MEERRRGLGRAFSAPSELVCLHIVAVNSHLATVFTSRRSTWENVQGHTQVGEAWRRAAHLNQPAEDLYCCNARSGFVPGGRC